MDVFLLLFVGPIVVGSIFGFIYYKINDIDIPCSCEKDPH